MPVSGLPVGCLNKPGLWQTSGPRVSLKARKPPGPYFCQLPVFQLLPATLFSKAGRLCIERMVSVRSRKTMALFDYYWDTLSLIVQEHRLLLIITRRGVV